MSQLNQQELQTLRHIIGSQDTSLAKMQNYAQKANDPQVRMYFENAAQDAEKTKNKLLTFLN